MKKVIFWFRRDLRLEDNKGLFHALNSGNKVIPIFIFDKNILKNFSDPYDLRVKFIFERIKNLQNILASYGSDLKIFYSNPIEAFKSLLNSEKNIEAVFCNRDYEPSAIQRDKQVADLLFKQRISFHTFKDHLIFEGNEVLKSDAKPYTVFTPYKNKWLHIFTPKDCAHFHSEKLTSNFIQEKFDNNITLELMGYKDRNFEFPIAQIKKSLLKDYDKNRDFPAFEATSLQGMHLRFGTLSVRKYVKEARQINDVWLSELIWREFFSQILFHFPNVVNQEFKEKYRSIKWQNNKKLFNLWATGQTGFPIVDAGMRELNATGYMHNRVRMITASFLIKDLQMDWRLGEAYFAQKLLDYDLASNNGNWQWASSSGCDAAPYFRIFNPESQLEKFDPNLIYVKKWIPEFGTSNYPRPIVEHKVARDLTLRMYKEALG